MESFRVLVSDSPNGDRVQRTVRLVGEFDIAAVPALREAFDAIPADDVDLDIEVDLAQTTFLDAAVARTLVDAAGRGVRRLVIVNCTGLRRRVLEICGAGQLLDRHADIASR